MTAVWKRNHAEREGNLERDMTASEDSRPQPPVEPDFVIDQLRDLTSLPLFDA
jgi:hypothetical protein